LQVHSNPAPEAAHRCAPRSAKGGGLANWDTPPLLILLQNVEQQYIDIIEY
jgi:hypothetical protein